jgi:hypothetical protein
MARFGESILRVARIPAKGTGDTLPPVDSLSGRVTGRTFVLR